jgi:hypothetical protein
MTRIGHYATHNDTPFPSSDDETIVVLQPDSTPTRPSSGVKTYVSSSDNPGICNSIPQDLPYIYTPWVNCTRAELLSVADQCEEIVLERIPRLFFPSKLAVYDLKSPRYVHWIPRSHYTKGFANMTHSSFLTRYKLIQECYSSWRDQWITFARVGGVKVKEFPDSNLSKAGGLTPYDWNTISLFVAKNYKPEEIWRYVPQ